MHHEINILKNLLKFMSGDICEIENSDGNMRIRKGISLEEQRHNFRRTRLEHGR